MDSAFLQIRSRMRDGILRGRPTIYILIVLGSFILSHLYQLRTSGIFDCPASGYTSDRFLADCEAKNYGDYEHGAFWFDLEPAAAVSAASADVLFLGPSRVQFAFSTSATAQWLSSASARYYLLGFIGNENSIFAKALLHKLRPRAKVYIINTPEFFRPSEAPYAKIVMHDDAARSRYEVKRLWQFAHKPICGNLAAICGHGLAIFRSRQTGAFYAPAFVSELSRFGVRPVSYDPQIDPREIDEAVSIGQIFLSELPVKPECVVLTAVPTVSTKLGGANAIADGLGKKLVAPPNIEGLQTFDGNHLDQASAESWSEAFFKTAGSQIQKCLEDTNQSKNAAASASRRRNDHKRPRPPRPQEESDTIEAPPLQTNTTYASKHS